ncbi:hypothetical protein DV736_g5587, partial [Chaetothyriales sp. CBS 134916]
MPPHSAQHGTPQDSDPPIHAESAQTAAQTEIGVPGKTKADPSPDDGVTVAEERLETLQIEPPTAQTAVVSPTKELPSTPPRPERQSATEKPYNDPTPKTPALSREPSHQARPHADDDEKATPYGSEEAATSGSADTEVESTSEIQSIMEQFANESAAPTREEIMSPRQELSSPMLASAHPFPPRQSSLEALRSRDMDSIAQPAAGSASISERTQLSPPPLPPKPESPPSPPVKLSSASLPHHPLPPEPEPEPDLPFDFHRFLEQLRHKSADPVAKFLRSFLTEFGKKQWMVHEQVKIIGDFLAFITNKMALCDVWREVSENEFDNAKEGMEKLVMNRLYPQTFSPAIAPAVQLPRSRSKGRGKDVDSALRPGRRGQHQEDVERDEVLSQKIRIYRWVREDHLDIPPVGPNGERFLRLAQQELLKIRSYRAPRDKVICVLNCCKVIFGLLKNAKTSDTSADSFVPLLIYVVLQANPEHLVSNIQYILRFRNQDKLGGEAGYYLSSLSGAIQFIEGLDRTSLTVSDEEFEHNVEAAVSEIAAQNREAEALGSRMSSRMTLSEKGSLAGTELTPRHSLDVTTSPRARTRDPKTASGLVSSNSEDNDAVGGLLRTIQKPLSTIGRIFSDQDQESPATSSSTPASSRLSPALFQPPRGNSSNDDQLAPSTAHTTGPLLPPPPHQRQHISQYEAQEAAARQASAEVAEARRRERAEHRTVVETLCSMFPNLDKEVIDDVVRQKQGRVGLAVDACLALTAGS